MKYLIKSNVYYLVAFLCFGILSLVAIFIGEKGDLILLLEETRNDSWTIGFKIITFFGEAWAFLCAILIMIFISYRRAVYIAFAGIISIPIIQSLKSVFAHPRPIRYFEMAGSPDLFSRIEGVDWLTGMNSFPSGHTAAAFVLFSIIGLTAKNKTLGAFWLIPAISAGASRIYLRHHFLEDVLLGACLGLMIAYFTIILLQKPSKKWFTSESILAGKNKMA